MGISLGKNENDLKVHKMTLHKIFPQQLMHSSKYSKLVKVNSFSVGFGIVAEYIFDLKTEKPLKTFVPFLIFRTGTFLLASVYCILQFEVL